MLLAHNSFNLEQFPLVITFSFFRFWYFIATECVLVLFFWKVSFVFISIPIHFMDTAKAKVISFGEQFIVELNRYRYIDSIWRWFYLFLSIVFLPNCEFMFYVPNNFFEFINKSLWDLYSLRGDSSKIMFLIAKQNYQLEIVCYCWFL